ncbi:hypothetical protein [Micromonospora chersina]|uniref:hypothetical protein n=1 Tax=Micromonospora chersina TaxID=47854 RepID=UPI0037191205
MDRAEALLQLAKSDDFSERARAGTELSQFAGSATVDQVLLALLLDDGNTSPVQDTAEALIKRGDRAGSVRSPQPGIELTHPGTTPI